MHIKNVKVNNPKNVLVQVPGFISRKWALTSNDELEVSISEDEQCVIIRPKKIRPGSNLNFQGPRVVGGTTGHSLLQSFRQVSQRSI